jgi:hypothetical protein
MKSNINVLGMMASLCLVSVGCGGPMESEGNEQSLVTTEQGLVAYNGYNSQAITVRESNYDVDTGVDIPTNHRVVFSCSGSIWAGVWFTGNNGPEGWVNSPAGNDFPLPGSPSFGMLAKLGGSYQYIGTGKTTDFRDGQSRLFLRINDNVPANGSGAFTCYFSVYSL